MTASVIKYRPEIDGLRCIAVLSVIFYHANVPLFSGGFIGVDIFFVISGFLITSIISKEIAQRNFRFLVFYERRIRRLFPALFAMIAVTVPLSYMLLTPEQLKEYSQSIVATILFASNIFFRIKSGYFSADADTIPLLHTWSLAVEEQYYVLFPLFLIAINRFKWLSLNIVLILTCAVSFGYCLYKQPLEPMGAFFLLPSRGWELAVGALLAINFDRLTAAVTMLGGVSAKLIEAAGTALIIVPLFAYDHTTVFPGWATVPPVIGTALVILASNGRGMIGRVLASPPFVGVGLISYSAYLWHQPIFALVRASMVERVPNWLSIALIGVTMIVAYLSWRFVEQPFRSRSAVSRNQIFGLGLGASIVFVALGLTGHVFRGFPGRYSDRVQALAVTMEPDAARERCHANNERPFTPATACRNGGANVNWAVVGDSLAIESSMALADHLKARGQGVLHFSYSACLPALTFTTVNPGCNAWLARSVNWLETETSIENVVLIFRHSWYLFGDHTLTYPAAPDVAPEFLRDLTPAAARDRYWQDFTALVTRMAASGKHVYVAMPFPELPTHVERFIYGGRADAMATSLAFYDQRNAYVLARMKRLASIPGVSLLDPRAAVCDAMGCWAVRDNKALYYDDNHFTVSAARRFIAAEVKSGRLP